MKLKKGKRLPFKRRRIGKTDYQARLSLLKAGMPRFVVRRAHNFIHIQLAVWKPDSSDNIIIEDSSKSLRKFGWQGHCGNIPAAYLTGLLVGVKSIKAGMESAVLDAGLQTATKGNAIFAAVRGARDAGMDISASEEMFPDDSRLHGGHVADYGKSRGAKELPKVFDEVKKKIMEDVEER